MEKSIIIFLTLIISLSSTLIFAKENTKKADRKFPSLKLSNSAEVKWPNNLKITSDFLPSFSGFALTGEKDGKKFTGWISHKTPDVLANTTSVERVWKENQENSKKIGEVQSKDFGCKEIKKFIFKCEREAEIKSGEFVTDSLYWNNKSDLVFVRANSLASAKHAREIYELFKVEIGDKK